MPAYHYVALNQKQQELGGVIESADEPGARKKLNDLGLSVVSLKVTELQQQTKPVFEFEAFDKNKKKVSGTIVSDSGITAYVRLFEEYELNLVWLVAATASPEEKKQQQEVGIAALRQEYEETRGKVLKNGETASEDAGTPEKQELLEKIEFTMQRVNEFLGTHGADMKPEQRSTIQSYLDQLVRIKGSTNLEHIKTTCARMLDHLQKQELFINEQQQLKESAEIKIETKDLLSQLKRSGLQQDITLERVTQSLEKQSIFRPLAHFLAGFREQNPEVTRLKEELSATMHHIFSYIKMYIFAKKPEVRTQAWQSIQTLFSERKRLKAEIDVIRKKKQQEKAATLGAALQISPFTEAIGWILSLYLAAYIISYPLTIKTLNIPLRKSFFFYHAPIIQSITLLLFFVYAVLTIRRFWLRESQLAPYVLYPISLVIWLLTMVNLV